jgi:hypothetical protein
MPDCVGLHLEQSMGHACAGEPAALTTSGRCLACYVPACSPYNKELARLLADNKWLSYERQ